MMQALLKAVSENILILNQQTTVTTLDKEKMLNVPWMSLSFYPLKKKVFFFA
jgi:hypothetical protein